VRHVSAEDGEAISAEIITPDADGWDPQTLSDAAHRGAILAASLRPRPPRRGHRRADGRPPETWRLTDLGAVMTTTKPRHHL
jgi:hypothetical protein